MFPLQEEEAQAESTLHSTAQPCTTLQYEFISAGSLVENITMAGWSQTILSSCLYRAVTRPLSQPAGGICKTPEFVLDDTFLILQYLVMPEGWIIIFNILKYFPKSWYSALEICPTSMFSYQAEEIEPGLILTSFAHGSQYWILIRLKRGRRWWGG